MGIQVFARKILEDVSSRTDDPDDHEHVTLYIYRTGKDLYSIHNMSAPEHLVDPYLRLTLDTQDDLEFITKIFEALYPQNPNFDLDDILNFFKLNPELSDIYDHVEQRWV